MILKAISAALLVVLLSCVANAQDAQQIVKGAIDYWRGTSSYSEMTMTIHRPDWERSMSMRAWTEGDRKSLVRVTAPAKDKDNGTLMLDNNMWTFSPKVNRVIKVPSSMMSQSWMGSDFSNKDISRADDIVDQYDHTLLGQTEVDGQIIYVANAQDAQQIVKGAIDYWRGTSSYSEMTMTIHRPDWERSMSMRAWTEGDRKSLVRVTAPAKDKDNGTLMLDNNMWTFSPKVNRVIKVPSSMMSQSWMMHLHVARQRSQTFGEHVVDHAAH